MYLLNTCKDLEGDNIAWKCLIGRTLPSPWIDKAWGQMYTFQSLFLNHNLARQHHTNISQDSVLWKAFLNTSRRRALHLPCPDASWRTDGNNTPTYVFIWGWWQNRVFTGSYVSRTAQGLSATLIHPCSVNTEAMGWCVCVYTPGLQGFAWYR